MLELPLGIDATVHSDLETRTAFSRDIGALVQRVPAAVLRPRSAEAVAEAMEYCATRGIKVSARGEGHTVFGQSLLEDGLMIDNRSMSKILSIDEVSAEVGPGVLWTDLLHKALASGSTPTLTGFTDLSVGGTLSVGGVSSSLTCLQIDQVEELQVVTGAGDIVDCSADKNSELFEVVLGGLGSFGIITRAKVTLTPAPTAVRAFRLDYLDGANFFGDMRTVLEDEYFDSVYASWRFDDSRIVYELNLAKKLYAPAPAAPCSPDFTDVTPSAVVESDYATWATRTNTVISEMQRRDNWNRLPKPWLDVWLPDAGVEEFVCSIVRGLTPEDIGPSGFMLLIPQRRSSIKNPFFRIPEADGSDWIFLFDLLTVLMAANLKEAMLDRNGRLFHWAQKFGGTLYPIGASVVGRERYGATLPELERRKRLFDPQGILRPL